MENPYARVYGLTGVIGSGKSTVAGLLRESGGVVFDADEIARFVIDPASPYYPELRAKITAAFGAFTLENLFKADGGLNRRLLGHLTFGHPERVQILGRIMHPSIQREFSLRVGKTRASQLIFYDVPLLFEGGLDKKVKSTVLVYAPEALCVERAVARAAAKGEALTADAVRARLASQISIEEKRHLADYVIDNSGDLEALKPQVSGLYQKLKAL